jgi:hypothetical protein
VQAPQASGEAAPKPAEFSADASIASMEFGQQAFGVLPQAKTPLRQECGPSDAGNSRNGVRCVGPVNTRSNFSAVIVTTLSE